ncbi:MAG TPA: hypothetical protein VN455_04845 [Methanotrichaceae archaeon]|nr:hypothetical protein [Methanotrichaceae archaeon]
MDGKVLSLLICIVLVGTACASEIKVTTGPYSISFDLGLPQSAYKISMKGLEQKESLGGEKSIVHSLTITNKTGISQYIQLTIASYDKDLMQTSAESLESGARQSLASINGTSNIQTATRDIDGTRGAIGTCDFEIRDLATSKTYLAMYCPTFDLNRTQIMVRSTYPWDTTTNFLNSVHVEKMG